MQITLKSNRLTSKAKKIWILNSSIIRQRQKLLASIISASNHVNRCQEPSSHVVCDPSRCIDQSVNWSTKRSGSIRHEEVVDQRRRLEICLRLIEIKKRRFEFPGLGTKQMLKWKSNLQVERIPAGYGWLKAVERWQ